MKRLGGKGQATTEYLLATVAFLVLFAALHAVMHTSLTEIFKKAALAILLPHY